LKLSKKIPIFAKFSDFSPMVRRNVVKMYIIGHAPKNLLLKIRKISAEKQENTPNPAAENEKIAPKITIPGSHTCNTCSLQNSK
jgi:hypothetical protein